MLGFKEGAAQLRDMMETDGNEVSFGVFQVGMRWDNFGEHFADFVFY